jgi:hypothetical protein
MGRETLRQGVQGVNRKAGFTVRRETEHGSPPRQSQQGCDFGWLAVHGYDSVCGVFIVAKLVRGEHLARWAYGRIALAIGAAMGQSP